MSLVDPVDLADTFADIAREMEAAGSPTQTLHVVAHRAVETVPGCSYAGITLTHRSGFPSTVATTDEIAERVQVLQNELGEGPCLSAITDQTTYTVDDLRNDARWPQFASRVAAEMPVASVLSFRLFTSEDTTGALNLYAARPHAFDGRSRAIGTVLASHAAIAMLAVREHERAENLETALQTNRRIAVAIGIVMHSAGITEDGAFEFLVDVSQRLNRKVRDVADAIVEAGGVPSRFADIP